MKKSAQTKRKDHARADEPQSPFRRARRPESEVAPCWRHSYRELLALHDRLLTDHVRLLGETTSPLGVNGNHLADSATDESDRDRDLSLLSAEEDALREVEDALRRIESRTYGVCELTGKPIPEARLRAVPWTRYTAEAELELEMRGLARKPHLGKLGRVETQPEALSRTLGDVLAEERDASPSLSELEERATAVEPEEQGQPEPKGRHSAS